MESDKGSPPQYGRQDDDLRDIVNSVDQHHRRSGTDNEKELDPEKQAQGGGDSEVQIVSVDANGKVEKDVDEALQAIIKEGADSGGDGFEVTEEENRKLLRKIDWRILPLLCIVYGLQYLDKTTLSYASIMGIRTDTHLTAGQYQWLGSIFYLGYLVWEWPTSRLLQYLPLAKYTGFNIVAWGAVLCCMAACENFGSLMAVRFFLGLLESSVTPGFALFTSQWYRVEEQGNRTGIWFSFNGFAQIFGGVVAYGLSIRDPSSHPNASHPLSIAGWKVVFLLTGALTVVFGIFLLLWMPDGPHKAKWLHDGDGDNNNGNDDDGEKGTGKGGKGKRKNEKRMAIERIRKNQQGIGNKVWKFYQVKEAFMDPLTWLFVFYSLIADIPNGGITNYFSILVESFGYTPSQSLLYATPGGAVEIVTIIAFLYLGDRYNLRLLFGAISTLICLIGILLVYALPDDRKVGKLIGYYLTGASATGFVVLLSLISSNVAGYTKKTTVSALFLIAYCVGNLIGPQVFRDKDAPKYTPALITIVVCWAICVFLLLFIWFYNVRQNRWRDRLAAERRDGGEEEAKKNREFLDLTDGENLDFRYRT